MIRWIRNGVSRDCFLIGRWAIKVPSLRHGWRYFLMGFLANMQEESHWRVSKHPQLARVVWACPGGWLSVYDRYDVQWDGDLSREVLDSLPVYNPDPREFNYAIGADGQIVVLDYGHCECYIKYTEKEWMIYDTQN